MTMGRDFWRLLAWLLVLSPAFWAAVAFRSSDDGPTRPADRAPPGTPAD